MSYLCLHFLLNDKEAVIYIMFINKKLIRLLYTTSMLDHSLKPRSDQTKDYEIGICYFSAEHAVLESKNKYCFDPSGATCVVSVS